MGCVRRRLLFGRGTGCAMTELTRRDMVKIGLAAGAGVVAMPATRALGDIFPDEHPESPPVPAFQVPLAVPPVLQPVRRTATTDFYEITQRATSVPILPGRPPTQMWGYNGLVPGPTIV